jgi:hypothetical protein
VKALTVRQPWASLIAAGVKTIETRSWSTAYRGPIAVHAGKAGVAEPWSVPGLAAAVDALPQPLPMGAVVAVADLVDVLPMVTRPVVFDHLFVRRDGALFVWREADRPNRPRSFTDQRPFGGFAAGRFAWLLENVRPLEQPLPTRGRQSLWTPPDLVCAALAPLTEMAVSK